MKLIKLIELESGGEPIEAVIFGEIDKYFAFCHPNIASGYESVVGKVLSLDEALPYLSYELPKRETEFDCLPFVAYTASWVIFVAIDFEYGSFELFRLPRSPMPGWEPELITA